MNFKNKYRIVRDNYAGYEAQYQPWWFPFVWFQIEYDGSMVNTSFTIERAEEICRTHAMNGQTVKDYDPYS